MKLENGSIIIENTHLKLTLGLDGKAYSLICKDSGKECIDQNEIMPAFSVTEDRPVNNELKLSHPNKKMTFESKSAKIEGNALIIGFELVRFFAKIEVEERDEYVTFKLVDFPFAREGIGNIDMDVPPVASMRLLQLPIKKMTKFGDWLSVVHDDETAVALVATSPFESITSHKQKDAIVLTADAVRGVKVIGCTAALVVNSEDKLLDSIDTLEIDFDLPRGVQSRRSKHLNGNIYWTSCVNPTNVDKHIELATRMGMRYMLINYKAIVKEENRYSYCGDYDYLPEYPEGEKSLKEMLDKIKAAGIIPGFHFLQTFIGLNSRYVTPVADHRLNLIKHLTLSRPLGCDDTTIYVEENPTECPKHPKCKVLQFDGELIYYDSFSEEYPYRFEGCVRGYYNTNIIPHERGQIGGVLHICEFGATSVYINQESSLQDEIADKLAAIYNQGFEFAYFDGSEGTGAPFDFHVSNAQYRVLKKFNRPVLFSEGAAKSHFGWHYMSGGNAFDVFPADIFKEKIVEHPFEEAPRMAEDFTRVNFGWWNYNPLMMPDHYEYGNALAFSWDCPSTLKIRSLTFSDGNPRNKDNFEIFRRWGEVREKNILTEKQKLSLRNYKQEHILLINEAGEYELAEYNRVEGAANGNDDITAYTLTRNGKSYAVIWHTKGQGELTLPLDADTLTYEADLGGEKLQLIKDGNVTKLSVGDRAYLSSNIRESELITAIKNAVLA
ncbi:MAG: hypothetical protein J6D09_02440 [Clostridia bacterium]|nr:hypothetical protein [Clostridia bacterium]